MNRKGFVLRGGIAPEPRADFYLPVLGSLGKASHVFLDVPPQELTSYLNDNGAALGELHRSYVVSLVGQEDPVRAFELLDAIGSSFVVIVPVRDDLEYWRQLLRLNKTYDYVLLVDADVRLEIARRYKCLRYSAVYPSLVTLETAQFLLQKSTKPDILLFDDEGDNSYGLSVAVEPYSDTFIDPLQPLTQDLGQEVYLNFEQDKVKYTQYDGAIETAIEDLRCTRSALNILVIGPGRGPLLNSVLKYARPQDRVVAVERNVKCIPLLQEKYGAKVRVIADDIRTVALPIQDLIVSELLGSFACNEASPEILSQFTDSRTIMIPQSYRSYVHPIFCDLVTPELTRPYLACLNSYFAVAEPQKVFEFHHPGTNSLAQECKLTFEFPSDTVNALQGYFEADLYGPFRISILPDRYRHETCKSWYPMIFPVGRVSDRMDLVMSRKTDASRFWYEWTVNDKSYNQKGEGYSISLHE